MIQQQPTSVPEHWPSEAALISAMQVTFPGLTVRPIREYGSKQHTHGAWVYGEARMADGLPIFSSLQSNDSYRYDGKVHLAFTEWLSQRGWLIEEEDALAFLVTSKAEFEDEMARDKELGDLLEQRNAAAMVLAGLEIRVAQERAQIAERCGDPVEVASCRNEEGQQRERLNRLRAIRDSYAYSRAPSASNSLPF